MIDDGADRVWVDHRDQVAWIRLSHPGRRNALTWRMYDQLAGIAAGLDDLDGLRAVVIEGDPENGFAAGTDIGQFTEFASAADGVAYERRIGAVIDALSAIRVPVIAKVHRVAVGAGLVLTACADLVVAEQGARFGAPIARTLGNCLPAPVIRRMRDRLGVGPTNTMLLTGRLLSAESLHCQGFVTEVVPAEDLDATVEDLLRRIRSCAPLTLYAVKQLGARLDASDGSVEDEDLLALCYGSRDFAEGVDAFLAGRAPAWTGS